MDLSKVSQQHWKQRLSSPVSQQLLCPHFNTIRLCLFQIEQVLEILQSEHALNCLSQRIVNKGRNPAPNEKLENHHMPLFSHETAGKGLQGSHYLRPAQL